EFIESEGKFCYRVKASSVPVNEFPNETFESYSNQVCIDYDPLIWVPNSFVVDGFNRTFFPVISFADTTTYRMIIYSRWGDVIFDTNSYSTPWDGQMRKDYVHENEYVYHIMIENHQGILHERRGTVLLLNDRDQ
ncbi:MAG: gliding motility-associated C-terminal domain-containing protein, partial [Bacteroidota bacterium]